jgi:hypothetical protein
LCIVHCRPLKYRLIRNDFAAVADGKLLALFVIFSNKWPDNEARTPVVGEEAVEPVAQDDELAAEADQVPDMYKQPGRPGNEPAEVEVFGQVGYGAAAANDGKRPFVEVVEGAQLTTALQQREVGGEVRALLPRRGGRWAIFPTS